VEAVCVSGRAASLRATVVVVERWLATAQVVWPTDPSASLLGVQSQQQHRYQQQRWRTTGEVVTEWVWVGGGIRCTMTTILGNNGGHILLCPHTYSDILLTTIPATHQSMLCNRSAVLRVERLQADHEAVMRVVGLEQIEVG
jgi:hypothetical protein